jgi:tellurite resistance protein TerC
MDNLISQPIVIIGFSILVIFMLILDLGVFNKKSHVVSNKEALIWSLVWIGISLAFAGFIWLMTHETMGNEKASQFLTAYTIEKALSVDNLFVFILVFGFFNVPREYHHKVLFWGIIGALVMRAIFIFSGVGLINVTYIPKLSLGGFQFILDPEGDEINYAAGEFFKINIVLTLFGLFLIYAGVKSWFVDDDDDGEKDFSKSPGARLVYKIFHTSQEFDKDKFFTIQDGIRKATPLLVVVGVIEFTDLLFAVDSIPAIFAVAPNDPFILYTSNIFAILGLRSLYFLLANFIHMFSRLKYGLSIILAFIGVKMVIAPMYHIESELSLLIVFGVLAISLLSSVWFPIKEENAEAIE